MSLKVLWVFLIVFTFLYVQASAGLTQSDKFSNCTVGQRLTHKNTAGRVKLLICTEKTNGVPRWQYIDGSSTFGEVFNPARDCSDIVDHLPKAKDGFYWVTLKSQAKQKVWCDLHTDGGGFMLVGMKDSPVSWTVPSNHTPVHPQGPPHWSSVLGGVKVLDFRVQFSTDKTFKGTKANWMYRLEPHRELGNLFTINNGCPYFQAGISNISFVKDLMTKTVLKNDFKCSKFGHHVHERLGWGKMNYCLRKACKNGYAVLHLGVPIVIDKFGSYSYSAVSPFSGMNHNSTAFVGCDQSKCCACFGPKGGRKNYCGPKCTAINGGTVMKNAFVWFWVRNRMPTRLWERCMEFKINNSASKLETHFINPKSGTIHKGSCSKQFKAFLNEGTITVSDKESFEEIPNVPGLISYREDNKQLYVNQGSQWKALGSAEELQQLQHRMKIQESKMSIQETKIQSQETMIQNQETKIQSQETKIQNQETKLQNQETKIQSQETKIQNQETKIQSQETKIQSQETKIQNQETKIQNQENTIKKLEGLLNRLDLMHFPTCSTKRKRQPSATSGMYYIYPQRPNSPPFVQVYCNMTSKNSVGVTEIGHDSESAIKVDGYEVPGSYNRTIKYNIAMTQIVAIIQQSKECEQFVKYKCYNAGFWFGSPTSWWVSRDGAQMKYWGGAKANSGKCACGMTNSCVNPRKSCNCDQNTNIWTEDCGYLTDKNTLPVTQLRFGDTSTYDGNPEFGYHTVGKLRCWG